MEITVYTLTTDTDAGTATEVFASEEARDEAAWQLIATYFSKTQAVEFSDLKAKYQNPFEAWSEMNDKGEIDTITGENHEIEIPLPPIGITIEGGMLQSVFSYAPDLGPEIFVIDHDTDGHGDEDTCALPGTDDRAFVSRYAKPEQAETPEWFAELSKSYDDSEG